MNNAADHTAGDGNQISNRDEKRYADHGDCKYLHHRFEFLGHANGALDI